MSLEPPPNRARRITDHPVLGLIPDAKLVTITFDGQPIQAREGEPVAVAILAAGVRTFRTMPRSGEPRGGYCFVGRCSDCLVVVDGKPNVLACQVPVQGGLNVSTQHGIGIWGPAEPAT